MKGILEFDLPEDEKEHRFAINGKSWWCVCWDMSNYLRNKLKYEEHSEETTKQIEDIQGKLIELMNDRGLILEQ